jgi:hypothetical protein
MPPFVAYRRADLASPTLPILRLTKHDSQPCDERFNLKIDLRRHLRSHHHLKTSQTTSAVTYTERH